MGWRWHDDDDHDDYGDDMPANSRGFADRGLGDIPDLARANPRLGAGGGGGADGGWCATRRLVQSRCHTEEAEPGRFVRKCEKTEQLLRDCVGRPSEVVESKTENTEEDVTDEVSSGWHSLDFQTNMPFQFPGLRSDIEALERGLFGSLGNFLEEAERMTSEIFQSFRLPGRESRPFGIPPPSQRHIEEDTVKDNQSDYSEFSGQIRDV